jgi:hypothetical protein
MSTKALQLMVVVAGVIAKAVAGLEEVQGFAR